MFDYIKQVHRPSVPYLEHERCRWHAKPFARTRGSACCAPASSRFHRLPYVSAVPWGVSWQAQGSWKSKEDNGCGFVVAPNCLCYTCVFFTYKGCPFSGSQAWGCGENCIVGPCISIRWDDPDTMKLKWLCCPASEHVKKSGAPPTVNEEMAR